MTRLIEVWTDGSCPGNPGPGGWAAVLCHPKKELPIFGSDPDTTNQRMELVAAIEGLRRLKGSCRVKLYSDSAYLVNAMTRGWVERWIGNGWRTAKKEPVKNRDLWIELDLAASRHEVEWVWVKGHSDHELNNRADALAHMAALGAVWRSENNYEEEDGDDGADDQAGRVEQLAHRRGGALPAEDERGARATPAEEQEALFGGYEAWRPGRS